MKKPLRDSTPTADSAPTADAILERMVVDCLELIELLETHERRATNAVMRDALTGATACAGEILNNVQDVIQALQRRQS